MHRHSIPSIFLTKLFSIFCSVGSHMNTSDAARDEKAARNVQQPRPDSCPTVETISGIVFFSHSSNHRLVSSSQSMPEHSIYNWSCLHTSTVHFDAISGSAIVKNPCDYSGENIAYPKQIDNRHIRNILIAERKCRGVHFMHIYRLEKTVRIAGRVYFGG